MQCVATPAPTSVSLLGLYATWDRELAAGDRPPRDQLAVALSGS